MKCVMCKGGETKPGHSTVTFDEKDSLLVLRGVPAEICKTCGEAYFEEEVTGQLLKLAKGAREEGVEVKIMKYVDRPASGPIA